MATMDTQHLHGVVDMGSNGIRFSITDLSPPTTRLLPTLYQSRAAISLYDAQYPSWSPVRIPLPSATITAVIAELRRFKTICASFHVPAENIAMLATEATRTAPNSAEFLAEIKAQTGWDVTLLSKHDEARLGAAGVRSSLHRVEGLVMDLRGGSVQLSYVNESGLVGGESMPYGAAALARRLEDAQAQGGGPVEELAAEIRGRIKGVFDGLGVREGGTLYLSGGGFRGWGYVLMSRHAAAPYPIAVVNGLSIETRDFMDTELVVEAVQEAAEDGGIHRVSKRRSSQVPAVALLVQQLTNVVQQVHTVRFCQGGVREGYLFDRLPTEIQAQHPLVVAAGPVSKAVLDLLHASLPQQVFTEQIIHALGALIGVHDGVSVDSRAAVALRHTTTGAMAGVHGLAHEDRAVLGILLAQRHGGRKALPPGDAAFYDTLAALLTAEQQWWAKWLGAVASIIGAIHPRPPEEGQDKRLNFRSSMPKEHKVELVISVAKGWEDLASDGAERLDKLGKKKQRLDGYGPKTKIETVTI